MPLHRGENIAVPSVRARVGLGLGEWRALKRKIKQLLREPENAPGLTRLGNGGAFDQWLEAFFENHLKEAFWNPRSSNFEPNRVLILAGVKAIVISLAAGIRRPLTAVENGQGMLGTDGEDEENLVMGAADDERIMEIDSNGTIKGVPDDNVTDIDSSGRDYTTTLDGGHVRQAGIDIYNASSPLQYEISDPAGDAWQNFGHHRAIQDPASVHGSNSSVSSAFESDIGSDFTDPHEEVGSNPVSYTPSTNSTATTVHPQTYRGRLQWLGGQLYTRNTRENAPSPSPVPSSVRASLSTVYHRKQGPSSDGCGEAEIYTAQEQAVTVEDVAVVEDATTAVSAPSCDQTDRPTRNNAGPSKCEYDANDRICAYSEQNSCFFEDEITGHGDRSAERWSAFGHHDLMPSRQDGYITSCARSGETCIINNVPAGYHQTSEIYGSQDILTPHGFVSDGSIDQAAERWTPITDNGYEYLPQPKDPTGIALTLTVLTINRDSLHTSHQVVRLNQRPTLSAFLFRLGFTLPENSGTVLRIIGSVNCYAQEVSLDNQRCSIHWGEILDRFLINSGVGIVQIYLE